MIANYIPLLPLREKVARMRRMRGLPYLSSASGSTIPLTRQPSAATLSQGERENSEQG
jgi:hypothetical protein